MHNLETFGNYLQFSRGQLTEQRLNQQLWQVTAHAATQDYTIEAAASLDSRNTPMLTIVVHNPQQLTCNWLLKGNLAIRWIFTSEIEDGLITCQSQIMLASNTSVTVLHQQEARLDWQRDIHVAANSKLVWYSWAAGHALQDQLRLSLDASDSSFTAYVGAQLNGRQTCSKRNWHILHQAPRTQSQVVTKTVLAGGAEAEDHCLATVQVSGTATQTQVYSHTLLLDDLSKIEASPELEVYCEEVNCRHGATSGHLDTNSMFYLASRGLDPATATQLMIEGFLAEVVAPWQVRRLPLEGIDCPKTTQPIGMATAKVGDRA